MMEECVSSLEETVTEPIVELVTDSLITVDGSMEACQDKVVIEGFSLLAKSPCSAIFCLENQNLSIF